MEPATPDNQARGTSADAESEMPSRRYSIAEAAAALDVTTQTVQRWLRTTDTDILRERDAVERRLRLLNQTQVATLAKRHRRGDLRPISRIEQHLIARLRECERRIEELEATVERLQSQQHQHQSSILPASTTPLEPYVRRQRASSATRPLGPVALLPPVPDGWVPWARWAEDNGVPMRTVQNHIQGRRGQPPDLNSHRGEWQWRRTPDTPPVRVTEVFDPEQQEAARRYFGK